MYQLNIVVVEDDPLIGELLQFNLQNNGYEPIIYQDGRLMLEALPQLMPVSLFVLDIMLPGIDGFEICRRLKGHPDTEAIPVLMLSARGAESDRVRGLTIGADDYMTKPFGILELLARVESLLRRYGRIRTIKGSGQESTEAAGIASSKFTGENGFGAGGNASDTRLASSATGSIASSINPSSSIPKQERSDIMIGPLQIDDSAHRVFLQGQEIDLTNREYELLKFLVQHAGIAFSRDQLLHEVWGHHIGFDSSDTRTVDIHIHQLRRKVEAFEPSRLRIETLRGFGYRMVNLDAGMEPHHKAAAGFM